jgi:hypothetical protein
VPVPKELLPVSATLLALSVPPLTVTFPLKVLAPDRVRFPEPVAFVTVPIPLIIPLFVKAVDCQNCRDPLLVIAADIGEVTGLVIITVSPGRIVPPLVTVLVLVVCANADPQVKEKMAKAIPRQKTRGDAVGCISGDSDVNFCGTAQENPVFITLL